MMDVFSTAFVGTFGGSKGARPSVVGATDGAPFLFAFETITRVRAFAVKARGGGGKLKLTSALGTLQILPLGSDAMLLWFDPTPGDELTAIAFVGTADLEYVIAGDP